MVTHPETGKAGLNRIVAIAALIVLAAVVLIAVVLPYGFGIHPLRKPVSDMTELERGALREGVLTLTDQTMHADRWERELAPFEAIEFKYTMAEGQPLVFSWRATAPVHYDLHSHSFSGGEDLTEGFGKGESAAMNGLYVAPYTGIHGWYWQNRTLQPVTVVLEASGGFTHSTVFEGGLPRERPIAGESAPAPAVRHTMKAPD